MNVFDDYAEYYDLMYQDKDYPAEAAFADELIRQYAPGARQLLELGSGTGKHAAELAARGYSIHGVEQSANMCDLARKRFGNLDPALAQRLSIEQGDMAMVTVSEKVEAVMALFHVLGYQTSNNGVLATFRSARETLTEGGIFLFDFWYGPAVISQKPSSRVKSFQSGEREIVRVAEPVWDIRANRVDVHYELTARNLTSHATSVTSEVHEVRYFFEPELEGFLDQSGFAPVAWGEWLTRRTPSSDTWGVYCVARAT